MMLIRAFEKALMRRPDHGFQLLSSGEEAVAVGVCAALRMDDQLLSSGRSIAAALARGLDPGAVMAELIGKETGPCRGRGGRGHLAQPSKGFFGAHAVVAGNLTIAAGVALSAQMQGRGSIVVCIFGDGACGSGALHETMNIAALWKLPLMFVCDNNGYSITTRQADALAPKRLADLASAFGIPSRTIDGMDVIAIREGAMSFAERARSGLGPSFLECLSERFSPHSTATRETRSADEIKGALARCAIRRLSAQLEADGTLGPSSLQKLEDETEDAVAEAISFADDAPYPDARTLLDDVV